MEEMHTIPKTIHLIWLGDEEPKGIQARCIRSWKKYAPAYTIRKWGRGDFPEAELPQFVREAIAGKKWAFATDYLRLYVLYREGGIYMDSDVMLVKSPDPWITHGFVSCIEYLEEMFQEGKKHVDASGNAETDLVPGMAVQSAFLASEPGHPFVKACMEYYQDRAFVLPDGSYNIQLLAPHVYALKARQFGFRYKNELQQLEPDMTFYPSELIAPYVDCRSPESVGVHLCAGSWRDYSLRVRARNLFIRCRSMLSWKN